MTYANDDLTILQNAMDYIKYFNNRIPSGNGFSSVPAGVPVQHSPIGD